jgi:HEAT repeat protein
MALHTLAMMGPAAGSALPAVIQLAQASPMQASACLVLGEIGGPNAEVLTAFQSILPNLSPDACRNAMMVLGQFAAQSVHLELLLPMLLNALQSPRADVSDLTYTALYPLGEARLPPSYKSVEQTIAPLVSHPDVRVRMILARFLDRFAQKTSETEAVLPGLLVLARDTNSVPKLTALRALSRAGIQTNPVWQAAEDAAVKEADQEIIQVVAEILLKPEAPKERAVPLFEKLLAWQETSLDNRVLATEGLWRDAGKTNIYIETLGERVANGEDGGRWAALEKLGRFAKGHAEARRQIERGLKSPNPRIRGKAGIMLGQCGPVARSSLPALAEALKDDYKNVRDAAQEALEKIKTPLSAQTSQ